MLLLFPMNWLNVRTELSRSPHFVKASCASIGAWLRVHLYCCEQENGGILAGAATWSDRQWLMACGVTKKEVRAAGPLLLDDGVSITVTEYSRDKELQVRQNRENGGAGGKVKTSAKTQAARANGLYGGRPPNPSENPSENRTANPSENPSENPTEWNGREEEGNGKETRERSPAWVWQRIGAIFGRQKSGEPPYAVAAALSAVALPTFAELDLLAAFMAAALADEASREKWHPRETASALAQNLADELDKARRWQRETGWKASGAPAGIEPEPVDWREKHAERWPDAPVPDSWSQTPAFARKELTRPQKTA